MENLLNLLNSIHPLRPELREHLRSVLKTTNLPKRTVLLTEGAVSDKIYFIEQGFARAFYYNKEKETTSWFMGQNDIMISVYSFFTQSPSFEYLELLEDSILFYTTYEQLQEIYRTYPEFNIIGRIITEQYYIKSEARAISLRAHTAKERYDILLKDYPGILQKASLGQIASYLGIKQETLSRIRGKKYIVDAD